jgi:hypothetical protein
MLCKDLGLAITKTARVLRIHTDTTPLSGSLDKVDQPLPLDSKNIFKGRTNALFFLSFGAICLRHRMVARTSCVREVRAVTAEIRGAVVVRALSHSHNYEPTSNRKSNPLPFLWHDASKLR